MLAKCPAWVLLVSVFFLPISSLAENTPENKVVSSQKHSIPLMLLLGAGAVTAIDEIDMASRRYLFPYHQTKTSRDLRQFGNYAQVAGPAIGSIFALQGMAFKNSKSIETAVLAWESFLVAGGIEQALKFSVGRGGPGVEDEPLNFSPGKIRSPFPSGHTTVVVAAATVFAEQYPRWYVAVPAYGLAGGVVYSRLTTNQHWMSDVVIASLLGFSVSHTLRTHHQHPHPDFDLSVSPGWIEASLRFGGDNTRLKESTN